MKTILRLITRRAPVAPVAVVMPAYLLRHAAAQAAGHFSPWHRA